MPAGRAFRGLKWCESSDATDAGVRTVQRTWHTSGTKNVLLLQIIDEGRAKPGNGPAFLVFDDKDDSPGCKG